MKNKILSLILSVALILSLLSFTVSAADTNNDTLTVDVPISVSIANATGIDLNIRLDTNFIESAKVVNEADCLADATFAENQNDAKFKVGIASVSPITYEGILFNLRLTLKSVPPCDSELCKLLQVKINEKITWQADNCIILSGVKDGGVYDTDIAPIFNEGTATLNGEHFNSGTLISTNGQYELVITDLNGKIRYVSFEIKKVIPGDVNDDTLVNNKDLGILMQYINGYNLIINTINANVNDDFAINNKDYVLIIRFINGWDVILMGN